MTNRIASLTKLARTNAEIAKAAADMSAPLKLAPVYKGRDVRVAKGGVSFDTIQSFVREALEEAYPPDPKDVDSGMCSPRPWVRDLYDDHVVYSIDSKLFSETYTFDGVDTVTLGGDQTEVETAYVPASTAASEIQAALDASSAPAEAAPAAEPVQMAKAAEHKWPEDPSAAFRARAMASSQRS